MSEMARAGGEGTQAVDDEGRTRWTHARPARRIAVGVGAAWVAVSEKLVTRILDPADGHVRHELSPGFDPRGVVALADALLITAAGEAAIAWDAATGDARARAAIGERARCACGDGERVLFGCRDGTVRVWVPGGDVEPLGRLKHPQAISGIARAGDHVVTASLARSVRVSSADDGQRVALADGLSSMPWCLACSPDGTRVAVGVGHAIQIREVPSLRLVDTWRFHRAVVSALAWTPRGLWSGAENGTAVRHGEDGRAERVVAGRGWVQDIASASGLTCIARAIERR